MIPTGNREFIAAHRARRAPRCTDDRGHTFEFRQPGGTGGNIVSVCRHCGQRLPGNPVAGVPPTAASARDNSSIHKTTTTPTTSTAETTPSVLRKDAPAVADHGESLNPKSS